MITWPSIEAYTVAVILFFSLGCLSAFFGPRKTGLWTNISLTISALGGLVATVGAITFWKMVSNTGLSGVIYSFPKLVEGLPPFTFGIFVDRLSIFFLALTGTFALLVSVYSTAWLKEVEERHRIAGVFNLFVLFTLLTILSDNIYFLLLFLEGMTLAFAYLVLYRHNKYLAKKEVVNNEEEMQAAKLAFKSYLIFSHVGVMFVATALAILAFHSMGSGAKSFDLHTIRIYSEPLSPGAKSAIFLLALLGLGIKAGMAPAHVWVSIVHPYSPTTTHAFSLGITIKVALYLMIRLFFDMLGSPLWWWGWLILLLAGITALVGVFYALLGHDLKTALASHSVENIGIMLAGIGLALIFESYDSEDPLLAAPAGLALLASLYHLLNHATFKGLLYLCTGAIEERTGTVEFDQLDGLMHYYPLTSITFLVGAVSIAGFPPFNGFISEWLTLQAFFAGMGLFGTSHGLPLLLGMVVGLFLLGSAFGLTALAFVKIVGEVLIGPARRPEVIRRAKQGEVPWRMRLVLIILAIACLLLGIFPTLVIRPLEAIATERGLSIESLVSEIGNGISIVSRFSSPAEILQDTSNYHSYLSEPMLYLLALIVIVPILGNILKQRKQKKPIDLPGPIWTCGTPYQPEHMQFTGSVLTALAWSPFRQRKRRDEKGERNIPYKLMTTNIQYVSEIFRQGYDWFIGVLLRGSQAMGDWFQSGDIRRYLWYIFGTFILVLIALYYLTTGS